MSILFFPRAPFSPNPNFIPRPTTLCHSSSSLSVTVSSFSSSTSPSSPTLSRERENGVAVLWFKHDLRVDDHPGLVTDKMITASKYRSVVPIYVFDRRILSRLSDETQELVVLSIEDLRKSLKDLGSDLMIRFGSAERIISDLAIEVKATTIIAEEEVEYELCKMMDIVGETLATTGNPKLLPWQTPFYDIKDSKDLPESYRDFTKLQLPVTSPVAPQILPGIEIELNWGSLPTFYDVKKFMNEKPSKIEGLVSISETSAETILQNQSVDQGLPLHSFIEQLKSVEENQKSLSVKLSQINNLEKASLISKKSSVGGGTNAVLNALAGYLRYLEGTDRNDWQELHEKLRNAETRVGASFVTLFGSALLLGIISRRRVHYEARMYEMERNAGFLSPFGYSVDTIEAAVEAVCSMEWYWNIALKSKRSVEGRFTSRIWRWNGHLIQYTVAGREGAAILLVHGFGAFLEHYRDNIGGIADDGHRVWAITLLGFGKSEKPNVVYTELKWVDLLKDFIIEVVGEPVHLVGNSIGGYVVALLAGIFPSLAKSAVLINSAGNVVPGYSSVSLSNERSISGAAWLGARALLAFLRLRLRNIVYNCYPAKPERVDHELIDEMIRASDDPGVVVVLESIFSFNISIPLNYLLEGYQERTLIVQGMKDPISDSKSILNLYRKHCPGVAIRELEAGHCPHDELPDEVNSIICRWVDSIESKLILLKG